MKNAPRKLLLCLSLTFCFSGANLFSDTSSETSDSFEQVTEDRVCVGSRPLDPELKDLIMKQRATETEKEEDVNPLFRRARQVIDSSSSQFSFAPTNLKPQFSLASYYPVNCHWVSSIGDYGRSIEMEDGSHWQVNTSDSYILNTWKRGDNLVIVPNSCWLSSGDYYITNKSNNTYVRADLYVGPIAFGSYSHWIVYIDYISGHVTLENGMTWCINGNDSYVFREWEVNDHVIIGLYDSWFSSYDHILINVNMDTYVRSKQY